MTIVKDPERICQIGILLIKAPALPSEIRITC